MKRTVGLTKRTVVDACKKLHRLLACLTVTLHLFSEQWLDCISLPPGACAKVHTSKHVSAAPSTPVPNSHVSARDDNDGAQSAGNELLHAAEAAKQRGNVLYQQAQYQQAISLYSVSASALLPCCAA